ncbi:NrfD/PsrC family molybdoenzyme membrane anchor subunit [Ornithinimicrobium sp. Y1694]|uniref:NrfD/PsrC family molybdoenzyme membrane anchor subunit n=1 Tax=Ornithinimicrobium sp. Y1694 TaxID=3418590 RepID=UPI003CE82C5F
MVPDTEFRSYYDHPIVKPAPWDWKIPTYLYTGGLAAGSGLIAAGAELTGARQLQRNARLVALGALGASTAALIADLGRPERFLAMMRTVKLTSPMSVGSWILAGFGGFTGAAAAAEILQEVVPSTQDNALVRVAGRGASLGSGFFAPPLAAYTAVLLSNTATPTWHGVYKELPFVFVGSGVAAAAGAAIITSPAEQTGPARRLAVGGAAVELAAYQLMSNRAGVIGEPLHQGQAGRLITASKVATVVGAGLTLLGRRSRAASVLGGLALNAGSALLRFGVFEAGMESARDPRYTVVPQRQRLEARRAAAAAELAEGSGADAISGA